MKKHTFSKEAMRAFADSARNWQACDRRKVFYECNEFWQDPSGFT